MNEHEFRYAIKKSIPEVPESFHNAMTGTLASIVNAETPQRRPVRLRSALAFALALLMLLAAAACAAWHWHLFDVLPFFRDYPVNADEVMNSNLHQETVNGVEITIQEAGYDGRILYLRYAYRLPDAEKPFAVYDENGRLTEGVTEDAEEQLAEHGVGWWTDHFWIDGMDMDMFAGSGSVTTGSEVPGEIIRNEYWRLDAGGVQLDGSVQIALPIGAKPDPGKYFPRKDHPEWYNADGTMKQPEEGLVVFTLDVKDALSKVITEKPNIPSVLEEVTAKVTEAAYGPLMTCITLELAVNPAKMTAYLAEHGDGCYDEDGNKLWDYTGMDVFGSWIASLQLVDGEGQLLFPNHYGNSGYGEHWAEFLYPHIETLPDELWLAPLTDWQADFSRAVRVR